MAEPDPDLQAQLDFWARLDLTPAPKPPTAPGKVTLPDWGPANVTAAHARWDHLAECLSGMTGLPLRTPPDRKGNQHFAPGITIEVIRTLFGQGRFSCQDVEAWFQDDGQDDGQGPV
jgi:hypothetical protein